MPVSTIGVYGAGIKNGHLAKEFPREPSSCPLREDDVYHSCASLNHVKYVRVFWDEEPCHCIGILFQYEDESQQAVGQCRLGASREKSVATPSMFYYQAVKLQHGPGVIVDFAAEASEYLDRAGWVTRKMSGIVTFWFSCDSVVLIVDL